MSCIAAHALSSSAAPTVKEMISISGYFSFIRSAIRCPVSRATSMRVPVGISTVMAMVLLSDAGMNSVFNVTALITILTTKIRMITNRVALRLLATRWTSLL